MGVLKDYMCTQHGVFESREPQCPIKFCKGDLSVIFLQPVAIKSAKTKNNDKTLNQLALEFDMTDIKSAKAGEHQTGYAKRKNKLTDKQFDQAGAAMAENQRLEERKIIEQRLGGTMWGNGGNISLKSVMGGQFKPVADESVSVLPSSVAPGGRFSQPRPGPGTQNDHEGLKLDK
jgi:hypothetical protein